MTEKQYPELPEPFGWLSYNVLTRKTFFGNTPRQSLQPGVYKHIRAYTKSQVIEAIDADRAMREPTQPPSGYVMVPSSGEPVAWLHTNKSGRKQAFTLEPPPGLKSQCQPLYTTQPAPQPQEASAFQGKVTRSPAARA